jgi:hypothetical protein
MAKFKKKFLADAFVSREYKSAITLEEYLNEIENQNATRYANNVLRRFNSLLKPLVDLKFHKDYYAKMLVKDFENGIMEREDIPLFVRTLLVNVIKTKYKVEILKIGDSYMG